MGTPTVTPNIGLQVPAFNQGNWQVPTNYNWALLDSIFGGEVTVPALSVDTLDVQNFSISNIAALILAACVQETPSGSYPSNIYSLSRAPIVIMGLYYNGAFLIPHANYTAVGNSIILNFTTREGDTLYAVYF